MAIRIILPLVLSAALMAGGLWLRRENTGNFGKHAVEEVQQRLDAAFASMDQEAGRIMSAGFDPQSPAWDEAVHGFIHTNGVRVVTWNQSGFIPDALSWAGDQEIVYLPSLRGDFLLKKFKAGEGAHLIGILPLIDRFQISNSFLTPRLNPAIFSEKDFEIAGPGSPSGESIKYRNVELFRLVVLRTEPSDRLLSFVTIGAGWILLFLVLAQLVRRFIHSVSPDILVLVSVVVLYAVRWTMIKMQWPALFIHTDSFDPKVFASSAVNSSMADMLMNALCILILVAFLFQNVKRSWLVKTFLSFHGPSRFTAGVLCLFLVLVAMMFAYNFIEVVYHNSTQSLEITQSLAFPWVRILAFLSVLIGSAASFLFMHVLIVLAGQLLSSGSFTRWGGLLIAGGLFIIQFSVAGNNNWVSLGMGLLFVAMVWAFRFNRVTFVFSFQLFIYLVISLAVFSLHHSMAVRMFHSERQARDQFRFGKDFLAERDVLGEFLLDQARQRIEKDQFIQTRMASPFLTKSAVADKIRRVHLNNYFDRYEIRILTLAGDSASKAPTEPAEQSAFLSTGYPGIEFAASSKQRAGRRYRVSIPISYQGPAGTVELDLTLKRVLPDNVFPELLVDNRFSQIYRSREFSYATFEGGQLVNSFGTFNYGRDFRQDKLELPELFRSGMVDGSYFHVAIEEADGSLAVVSAPIYPWSEFITNFSFWFVLGLALLLVVQGVFGLRTYFVRGHFNYTARIQLFIFLAFSLPVLGVSITTLTLIGQSSEEGVKHDFLQRSAGASQRVANLFPDDSTNVQDKLDDWLEENVAFSRADISIYSSQGELIETSQPALFENQLVSTKLNREAYRKIVLEGELQAVTNEQIGSLRYSSAYSAVLSPETGRLMAVVSLPFFESASYLQKGQILILSSILKVFVIVFLLFSLLSFWAASSLTFPIRFITRSLSQMTFTGQAKKLEWEASDEIGTMAKEYNRMVVNLEESKKALAQTEKELAWREIAKQVAHEIKNPLTPMKLTIQQLQQAGDWSTDKVQKSVDVLLRQVEILNQIAGSFSAFTAMPSATPQRTGLVSLVHSTAALFEAQKDGKVIVETSGEAESMLDPTSFSRALSNLIINAFQARREGQDMVTVTIKVTQTPGKALISIRDNGKGMSPDLSEKAFQPHFTTKESGSGLGLAVSRQIVNQASGRIWFESVQGQGSTFFIELPTV